MNSTVVALASSPTALATTEEKQGVALDTLYGWGSTCAGVSAIARQSMDSGELTIEAAQDIFNLAEKLRKESAAMAHLMNELFTG